MEYNGFHFTREELKALKSLRRKIAMDISCRVNSLYEKLNIKYDYEERMVRDGLSGSPSPYSDDKIYQAFLSLRMEYMNDYELVLRR